MTEKLNFIFERRSIRAYTNEPVPDSAVTKLLEAAMAAPSAGAKDPWRFVVIRNREKLRSIAAALPNGKFLESAAVGIVVCGDLDAAHDRQLSYLLQDCSAAIENLLLGASILGLGACWLGVHPRQDRMSAVKDILRLQDSIVPVSCLASATRRKRNRHGPGTILDLYDSKPELPRTARQIEFREKRRSRRRERAPTSECGDYPFMGRAAYVPMLPNTAQGVRTMNIKSERGQCVGRGAT